MKIRTFLKKAGLLLILFFLVDFLLSLILLRGLNKYYGFNKEAEVLISGSSMAMSGFNKVEIEHLTRMGIATYTHEGVSVEERQVMIGQVFNENSKSIKTVVYEVNPYIFSGSKTSENVHTIFYPYLDNKAINKFVKERADPKDYYINRFIRTKRFDSRLIRQVLIGYLGKYENLKTNKLDSARILPLLNKKGKVPVRMNALRIEAFENTMDLIQANHAKIVLIMMPMYKIKLQTFDSTGFQTLCKYFETYSLENKNVSFLNLNSENIINNTGYFSDPLHFNVYGQQQITKLVSSYLVNK